MTLREALQSVYDRHGQLTPQFVVDEAREGATEAGQILRARLEWDNERAGEAWRREQARELIRSVRVVYKEAEGTAPAKSVRGFHSVPSDHGHVFEPLEKVQEDPFVRKLVLAQMRREWKQMHARYREFEEFVEMIEEDLRDKQKV